MYKILSYSLARGPCTFDGDYLTRSHSAMLIESILSDRWALDATFHNRMAGVILRRIDAGQAPFEVPQSRKAPFAALVGRDDRGKDNWGGDKSAAVPGYNNLSKATTKSGQVVVLPIIGVMSRYGGYCSWGAEDMANWILEANRDDNVSAIVLEINSPGGQVDGTELLGETVRQSQKPVVAYVAGYAASAAYWVASQCREIVMESATTSDVGSIGVLAVHVDASAAYEKEGYKVTILRSDGSEDKALFNGIEPLSDVVVNETKASLNLIRSTFVKIVKAGRPGISATVFSGKMYPGKEALTLGMADRIGYLGDAIRRADLLARK